MMHATEKIARLSRSLAQIIYVGAIAVLGLLSACTSKTETSSVSKSARSAPAASIALAQSDYATNPVDSAIVQAVGKPRLASPKLGVAPKKDARSEDSDEARPWVALKSIGFFYNRADLVTWEAIKITEIVDFVAQHPGVEVGINCPTVIDVLSQERASTIYDALIAAGVTAARIHKGAYIDLPPSLDQRVEVFSRRSL